MTQEPRPMRAWNLGLRFALELAALGALGMWGYEQGDGLARYALAAGLPLAAAAGWGVFAVEGDPSRSGQTIVATPGAVRLGLELAFFGVSAWALRDLGHDSFAYGMGGAVLVHYAVSFERIRWLLSL